MIARSVAPTAGMVVSSSFNPGIVAAAFFASLTGCLLTVEILHRRGTALGNWRSWLETLACAISMGLVGIWCMHFIGNRAIVLGNGDNSIQLVYNRGWTVLSVFSPIVGLCTAFAVAETPCKSIILHRWAVGFSGVSAGLSVVGMHYIGNLGVSNYSLRYSPRFFVASFVIAIGDCLAVLILFYRWREQWISSWWKRLFCAILLAGGISAMHFTASTSCTYVYHKNSSGSWSRNVQVSIAAAFCGISVILIMCFLFFFRYREQLQQTRSNKVMLACALFDPDGRLLVTSEGFFPAKEITDQYNHRTFNEEFDTSHPVFQWMFRVTHNWFSVSDLIPGMKYHIDKCQSLILEDIINDPQSSTRQPLDYDIEACEDYSVIFRERFCVAAASLAADLQLPLHRLGTLYDRIIESGTLLNRRQCKLDGKDHSDLEHGQGHEAISRGQFMFVVREVTREEALKLLNTASSFRFADSDQVGRILAHSLRIPLATLNEHVSGLLHHSKHGKSLGKAGTWLSFFALIPTPGRKGFDTVVSKCNRQQLPDVLLAPGKLSAWQANFLYSLNDHSLNACLQFIGDAVANIEYPMTAEQHFKHTTKQAIRELTRPLPNEWLRNAKFLGNPLTAHYFNSHDPDVVRTTLYSFYVIVDVHSWCGSARMERIPLSLFDLRQRCYPGSPDHAVLSRDVHHEFGPMLAR